VIVNCDVVVDVDPDLLAFGILVGNGRQGFQGRAIDRFVKAPSGSVHPLELAVVEILKLFGNGPVQLLDAEKGVVPKRRQDPPLGYLHCRLRLGLVFRFEAAGGDDDRPVVAGKLMIGRIDLRFIVTGLGHTGLEIVRNEDCRNAAVEGKRPGIGLDPGGKIFGEGRPCKGVAAGAQGGDKKTRFSGLSGHRICYRSRLAGIIDKELFPGPVGLAKTEIELVAPLMVPLAELAVLISVRIGLAIFQPQQTEGDTLASQLLAEVLHRRQTPLPGRLFRRRRKQNGFQPAVVQIGCKRPTQAGTPGAFQVVPDGAAGNVATRGNLFVG